MGNILRRGLDAYQQTMQQKPEPEGLLKSARPALPRQSPPLLPRPESPPQADRSLPAERALSTDTALPAGGEDSKYRRVAKLLILIGSEQAAGILAELEPEQVERISREIASIRGIGAEEAEAILAEFRSLLAGSYGYSGMSAGGVEAARRILYAAMGPETGEALLNKAVPDSRKNTFDFLEAFTAEQVQVLLKDEAPATAALILSRLSPKLSAAVLGRLPAARKPEIMRRIARQGEVAPEVLERVAAAVREKARHMGGSGDREIAIDGMGTLAAILKQGDCAFGDRIITELEADNPGIGRDLQERLYTLNDVVRAVDRPLQEKLKTMPDRDIAVLLKGRGAEFREKILSCVSAGRRKLIREEGELLGAVPKRDCDAVAREFLAWFRLAREDGSIILSSDEDILV